MISLCRKDSEKQKCPRRACCHSPGTDPMHRYLSSPAAPRFPDAPQYRAAAVPCGMSNEKCLRVTGTVRANPRRERQSSHCMSQLHFWREPDEKLDGSFFLTSTQQKSILRGSEIFGYDEKEYPERMLQRAAGLVQGSAGRPWEDPLRAFRLNGRWIRPSKRERQAPVITGRALLDAH